MLGKRPLEGLTLTEPRPLSIPLEKQPAATRCPSCLITGAGEPIEIRVRLHAPSRYDELRSSIEAPRVDVSWP